MPKSKRKYNAIHITATEAEELGKGETLDVTLNPASFVDTLKEAESVVKDFGPGANAVVVAVCALYHNEPVSKSVTRRFDI